MEENKLIPVEQKGCRKLAYGCKDQLLINKMINEDCKQRKKNLSTAWVDYQKAYDSVPHSWILKCLEIYKIDPKAVAFLKHIMKQWKTTLIMNTKNGRSQSAPIEIRRGIFQGDSLSPLLFCITLFPLTELLKKSGKGNIYSKAIYIVRK